MCHVSARQAGCRPIKPIERALRWPVGGITFAFTLHRANRDVIFFLANISVHAFNKHWILRRSFWNV